MPANFTFLRVDLLHCNKCGFDSFRESRIGFLHTQKRTSFHGLSTYGGCTVINCLAFPSSFNRGSSPVVPLAVVVTQS